MPNQGRSSTDSPDAPSWPHVQRVDAPSNDEFIHRYLKPGRPIIFRGIVENWTAQRKWTWDFLRQEYGAASVSAYVSRHRRMVSSTEIGLPVVPLGIAAALDAVESEDGVHLSSWVEDIPAGLQADIETPQYCKSVPWLRRRFWITSAGVVTPAHQDPYDNLYGVLSGAKRFILVPPKPRAAMYPHSPFSRIPNFSRVDIENPDLDQFPRFEQAQPMLADVERGEMLFIPNLWWHHTRALRTTLALNYFWSRGWMVPLTRLAAVYRRLRRI